VSEWEALIDKHGRALLLYARQWAPSDADAEDALQEGFLRFWRKKGSRVGEHVPLLFTMVKRAAIDQARSRQRRAHREETAAEREGRDAAWFETSLDAQERNAAIQQVMQELPAEQREVLTLKIWGDLTFREIAASLRIPANTAASRYRYALKALRDRLEHERVRTA